VNSPQSKQETGDISNHRIDIGWRFLGISSDFISLLLLTSVLHRRQQDLRCSWSSTSHAGSFRRLYVSNVVGSRRWRLQFSSWCSSSGQFWI